MTFLQLLKRADRNDLVDAIYNQGLIVAIGAAKAIQTILKSDLDHNEIIDLDWESLIRASYGLNVRLLVNKLEQATSTEESHKLIQEFLDN